MDITETVTISLDEYVELIKIKNTVDNIQEMLNNTYLTGEEVCKILGLELVAYNKIIAESEAALNEIAERKSENGNE